ncbi:MAG: exodeoxyribonuclease VII small subunit [Clostridiales bacterium]|nr:exodeoxyribonuclease VII small subunit [Clostridiales bacterium]
MTESTLTFEQQLERLDAIVRQLERGDAPLDRSLALFEEGTALIRSCGALLDAAEQTVVRIKKGADGAPIEQPFEAEA